MRRPPAGLSAGQARRAPHSESLLSELDPLELLLPDSEELLLLSREGPPGGAVPDFSAGDAAGERCPPAPLAHPAHPHVLHQDMPHFTTSHDPPTS